MNLHSPVGARNENDTVGSVRPSPLVKDGNQHLQWLSTGTADGVLNSAQARTDRPGPPPQGADCPMPNAPELRCLVSALTPA